MGANGLTIQIAVSMQFQRALYDPSQYTLVGSNYYSRLNASKIKKTVYIIYVYCVYLLYMYKYTHMYMYIFKLILYIDIWGAWWQKLRDWGGASSLRPSGSLTQTQFHKHLLCTFYSVFIFFYHIYALVLCYFYIIFIFILLHCPLSGPDLIYISLLIIPCIIYYVTNKETLNFYATHFLHLYSQIPLTVTLFQTILILRFSFINKNRTEIVMVMLKSQDCGV